MLLRTTIRTNNYWHYYDDTKCERRCDDELLLLNGEKEQRQNERNELAGCAITKGLTGMHESCCSVKPKWRRE